MLMFFALLFLRHRHVIQHCRHHACRPVYYVMPASIVTTTFTLFYALLDAARGALLRHDAIADTL